MWVIKLGGSFAYTETLPIWLNLLAKYGQGKVVIVPGGGLFADQVRQAQAHWQFADNIAHQMALLAMEQYGLMMQGLCSKVIPVQSKHAIIDLLYHTDTIPVWLPTQMTREQPDIQTNWAMTSDSLAAWLARQLNADQLILVKSAHLPASACVHVTQLCEQEIVDACFPTYIAQAQFLTWCLHNTQYDTVRIALQGSELVGTRVITD